MNKTTETHESYGMISISKFTSNHSEFFGSDLVHRSGITIQISEASKDRMLSEDWYYAGKPIITIELSGNQFVDAITSGMNTEGVPAL